MGGGPAHVLGNVRRANGPSGNQEPAGQPVADCTSPEQTGHERQACEHAPFLAVSNVLGNLLPTSSAVLATLVRMQTSTTVQVIAANVRARMAWLGISVNEVQAAMGWSRRTVYNKLHAVTPFNADELDQVAGHLGCEPGDLFRVPEGFTGPSVSSTSALAA